MDLIFIIILTLITIPVVEFTTGVPRIILGVIVLLVFPGYSLMSALFPAKKDLSGMERAMLTFVLSFAVVALTGLALNYTPWGIRLTPIVITIPGLILVFCGTGLFRRSRLPHGERFELRPKLRLPDWSGVNKFDRALYICLVVVVIASLATLGYVIARPKPQEAFTNFYMLGPEGMMEDYPSSIKIGESAGITLGIENHENETTEYRVAVTVEGQTVQSIGPLTLGAEEKWSQDVSVTPAAAGENQQVEFLLYKNGGSEPYLNLRLWLDVTP